MKRRILICLAASILLGTYAVPVVARTLVVTNLADDGDGSLRAAIETAAPGDKIGFRAGLTGTITISSTLVIGKDLVIQGPGADKLAISGDGKVQVMRIASARVSMSELTIKDGHILGGGGINNLGTLSLSGCIFAGNGAETGGAIYNSGTLIAADCTFSNNSASVGGAIFNSVATLTVSDCIFSGNRARFGGAIGNDHDSTLAVTICTFSGNNADYGGGAISNWDIGTLTTTSCTFSDNSSGEYGGAIYNSHALLNSTDCKFMGNRSDHGGSIYTSGTLQSNVTNCTFSDSHAAYNGGAIDNAGNLIIAKCILSANSAEDYGGAIENNSYGTLTATNCIFTTNSAWGGGAIYSEGTLTTTNCTFSSNSAGDGGAIRNDYNGSLTATNCIFNGNSAGYGGALANMYNATLTATNCTFSGNSTYHIGGAIGNGSSASLTATNCTFSGNNAENYGGAIGNWGITIASNCILWGNIAPEGAQIYSHFATTSVSHSDVQSGAFTDPTNIDEDPIFVRDPSPGLDAAWGTDDDDYGNLFLQADSPCIDNGNSADLPADTPDLDGDSNTTEPIPYDLAGSERVMGDAVDMGAYEFGYVAAIVEGLMEYVQWLVDEGAQLPADGQPFYETLNSAIRGLEERDARSVINSLTAFRNQVSAMAKAGRLTSNQAQQLITMAQAIITALSS